MPELPEVETVKRVLENKYLNKTIKDVKIFYPKIIENITPEDFINNLIGQTIKSFDRYGKYLIIKLDKGSLLIHLRMEGKFKFSMDLFDKHSHIIFYFTDGDVLIYHDVRKFGKMFYFKDGVDIFKEDPLNRLGLEPKDITDIDYLVKKFSKTKKEIKVALLDQSIICGIGNIYADEILYECMICPTTPACNLNKEQLQKIVNAATKILNEAIKYGGTTIKSFQSSHGVDGLFQIKLQAYGKENLPCSRCNTPMVKIKIDGRGTCFCPNCQKG